ncbi:MAG: Xaa-Pro dipeptidase, partial [Candidatus Parcubacteria bacterium]
MRKIETYHSQTPRPKRTDVTIPDRQAPARERSEQRKGVEQKKREWQRRFERAAALPTHALVESIDAQSTKRIQKAREYMRAQEPCIDALVVAHTDAMIAEEYAYLDADGDEIVPSSVRKNGVLIITANDTVRLRHSGLSAAELREELRRVLPYRPHTKYRVVTESVIEGALADSIQSACDSLIWTTHARASVVAEVRREKTPEEIVLMERGQTELLQLMQVEIPKLMYEGMTEYELAQKIEGLITRGHGWKVSFPAIVAFGEHGAIPHHKPGDRRLKNGEPVLIDCGNIYMDRVCTDMTRNYWFGKTGGELYHSYLSDYVALRSIQEQTVQYYKAGERTQAADSSAREQLLKATKTNIPHGLGHGIAQRSVHAAPNANQKSGQRFQVGDVVSNEPGVYRTGQYGIRIEDVIAVTPHGPQVFGNSENSRDLITVTHRVYDDNTDGQPLQKKEPLSAERIRSNLDEIRDRMLRDDVDIYIVPKTEDSAGNILERVLGFEGTHGHLVMVRMPLPDDEQGDAGEEKIEAYFITDGRYAGTVSNWDTHGFTDVFITRPKEIHNGVEIPE